MICKLCICFYCILCTCKQTVCARSICIYCLSKWILQPSLLSTGQERKSWAPSSCSGTRLWHFHADDWFRCGEKREEVSGFGLCPLITLYYHTGGIYHQTPKASVHGGTLKPISSLTCNPSRSTKSSTAECYHIHFLCKSGMFPWKTKKQRTERKRGVWNPWKPLSCIFFLPDSMSQPGVVWESQQVHTHKHKRKHQCKQLHWLKDWFRHWQDDEIHSCCLSLWAL